MPLERGSKIQVHIERLSVGGRGVARHEGLVVFVDDSAPGDQLEVEITKSKKNFTEARIVNVVSPSNSRITPPCPVAGVCGGCNWQHVSYEEQLVQKRALVRESLQKFSGYDVSSEKSVAVPIPSPQPFRYRNRVQLHHDGTRLGFFKRESHEIIDIQDCPITESRLTETFEKLRQEFRDQRPGRLEIFLNEEGQVQRRDSVTQESTGPFAQVNTAQNRNLVSHVTNLIASHGGSENALFDLYAGGGNFSFPLAKINPDRQVVGVELNLENVRKAQNKITHLRVTNLRFVHMDVAGYLKRGPLPEDAIVILDPPRTGCGDDVMDAIIKNENMPAMIVYVSCHPVTLARDLKILHPHFDIQAVQPFDMFPQTDHIETVVTLARKAR